jgi:hypothetical protein
MVRRVRLKEFFLFCEAWGLIAFSRLILVFIPFRKILPFLGRQVMVHEEIDKNKNAFLETRKAISRASRYSFWRTKCFEQALCAKLMLKLRKKQSTIYFGVKNNHNEFSAHAWLVCNNEIITGGSQTEQFKVLTAFFS